MGLFARGIEEADIPTLILSATLDITAHSNRLAPAIQRMQRTAAYASTLARPPALIRSPIRESNTTRLRIWLGPRMIKSIE